VRHGQVAESVEALAGAFEEIFGAPPDEQI